MGTFVIFQINSLDRKFLNRNVIIPGSNQHIHFIFKPLTFCLGEGAGKQRGRKTPESGLGIRYMKATQKLDYPAGSLVAKTAAPWDRRIVKLSAAKDQMVLAYLLRKILIDTDTKILSGLATSSSATTPTTVKAATIVVAVIPITLLYPLLQKHFIKGINIGAVKG